MSTETREAVTVAPVHAPTCDHRKGCPRRATWASRTRHEGDGSVCAVILLCEEHRQFNLEVYRGGEWECTRHDQPVRIEWVPL